MMDCLYAIGTLGRSVKSALVYGVAVTIMAMSSSPAYAVLTAEDLVPLPPEDVVGAEDCPQAWPLRCDAGGEGDTGCGGWQIITDLAESETLGEDEATCSTGVRLGLGGNAAEGEPVGAMFPGTVTFAQSGRFRDGHDYGGVVVIKLDLDDGSPQCYARYMFLDRRDMVKTGEVLQAGQRIGSIASSDMNVTKDWWEREWPGMDAQVKIDIGCDEALVNLPQFMPREPFEGGGPEDEASCPLTKVRFPSRPIEYLATYESVTNLNCSVGARKDARTGLLPAIDQDNSELETQIGGQYVEEVNPRGFIKRKQVPVFSTFKEEETRDALWGANKNRSSGSMLFRDNTNYRNATALRCVNMREIFNGKEGDSITPENVRELLTHCTNQYILGRGMFFQVYEQSITGSDVMRSPLPEHLREFLTPEQLEIYDEWQALNEAEDPAADDMSQVLPIINEVLWRDLCQPLKMQPIVYEDYKVRELLTKSWEELLLDWPEENELVPVDRDPIMPVETNDYVEFPYERINDPAHPFSPRHIFAETDRERYQDYGVMCAATPVDLILGRYGDGEEKPFAVYGNRDLPFHQCIRCRIEINETKEACFADPWSFTNPGGCNQGFGPMAGAATNGALCPNLDPALKTLFTALEAQYGLAPNLLHAVATQESGCSNDARSGAGAMGMFQFMPGTAAAMGVNPWDPQSAADGAARYYAQHAESFNCDLPLMLAAYNCGPGCARQIQNGQRSMPAETQGYISNITAMLGGATSGCNANGATGVAPGAGGAAGGTGGSVFGGGGAAAGGTATGGQGTFDPAGCPAAYGATPNSFDGGAGIQCPAFSYPTPDGPGTGGYGCQGRFFYPPGCGASCVAHFNEGCARLRAYNGPMKGVVCVPGCPGRIHEGMDIAFEFGMPIYASADGVVSKISESGYVTIDHSGACIDPACTKRFRGGVNTRYYHMGMERVIVTEGQTVTRCQQIGSVGDKNTEGVPHLHWEAWDPANSMTGAGFGYYGLDQTQPYHSHVDDKSCTGGVWDAQGQMGAQGICLIALPVNALGNEDLEPPEYLTEYEVEPSVVPDPPSEGHHTKFDLEVPGMIYEGAWTECGDGRMTAAAQELCESLNAEDQPVTEVTAPAGTPPAPAGGVTQLVNPVPCAAFGSPYGPRNLGGNTYHYGQDIPAQTGTPIFAAADGVVETAGPTGGYGNFVVIRHADGSVTRYGHQSQICPQTQVGATVVQGQVIGYVGSTGDSTGPHLHFEIKNPDFVDPVQYLPAPTPGAAQCQQINATQCGQTMDGLAVGPGVGGVVGKQLCVEHPCSVRYDESDLVSQCAWPNSAGGCGTLGNYFQRHETDGDCCYNVTAPVVPLNVLKLRPGYDGEAMITGAVSVDQLQDGGWAGTRVNDGLGNGLNGEGGTAAVTLENPGAPEAYTFHEHFRNHMPYMRWWDTGAESGNLLQEHADVENPGGSFDALVGVGVEKNSCGIGGWGTPEQLDGNTSWLELKMYQARTQYMAGLRCISRYEKLYKRGAAEDYVLHLAGGNFATSITGTGSAGTAELEWPLGWRGYTSEPIQAYRFPYFISLFRAPEYSDAAGAVLGGGLDNALPGDILIWDQDVVGQTRLPHVAYVKGANNAAMDGLGDQQEYNLTQKRFFPLPGRADPIPSITVMDYNFGKYPDACGTTNWWGIGPERTIYKGRLPQSLDAAAQSRGVGIINCGNPDLASCVENYWGNVKIYRPWQDVRD